MPIPIIEKVGHGFTPGSLVCFKYIGKNLKSVNGRNNLLLLFLSLSLRLSGVEDSQKGECHQEYLS